MNAGDEAQVANGDKPRDKVITWLKQASRSDDTGAMLDLLAWASAASADDLLTAMGAGQEIIANKEIRQSLRALGLARFGEIDPQAGLELLDAMPAEDRHSGTLQKAFYLAWLKQSPQEAFGVALDRVLIDANEIAGHVEAMIEAVGPVPPAWLLDKLEPLATSGDDRLVQIWVQAQIDLMRSQVAPEAGIPAMTAWIEQAGLRTEARAPLLRYLVMEGLSRGDPAGAVTALRKMGTPVDEFLSQRVATELVYEQPEAAQALATTIGPGELRQSTFLALARARVDKGEAGAALDWLCRQGTDADYDDTYVYLADHLVAKEPARAIHALSFMTDSPAKKWEMVRKSRIWLQQDPVAARALLPPELVAKYDATEIILTQVSEVLPEAQGKAIVLRHVSGP